MQIKVLGMLQNQRLVAGYGEAELACRYAIQSPSIDLKRSIKKKKTSKVQKDDASMRSYGDRSEGVCASLNL